MSAIPEPNARDHVMPAEGPRAVTLVEYVDFASARCREAAHALHRLLRDFGGGVRLVLRHFPASRAHPSAHKAAEAAEAAGAQGKFWEMHDTLFAHQGAFSQEDLVRYADELELDVRRFKQELQDGTYAGKVKEQSSDLASLDAQEAPVFFLDGRRLKECESLDEKACEGALARAIEGALCGTRRLAA